MKLDWKRAGCASIAASGDFSFLCEFIGEGRWVVQVRRGSGALVEGDTLSSTMSIAEEWHESWLDKHDRPEWHDANDWLSWAEWRGREVSIHTYAPVYGGSDRRWLVDISPCHTHGFDTLTEAKEYAEKWIRERSA